MLLESTLYVYLIFIFGNLPFIGHKTQILNNIINISFLKGNSKLRKNRVIHLENSKIDINEVKSRHIRIQTSCDLLFMSTLPVICHAHFVVSHL